jgi:phosphohistidine phosphatase
MRHADAEAKKPGMSDFDRELTEIGREMTQKVALGLKRMNIEFELLGASPLVRAVQTAEIILEVFGIEKEVLKINELIPGSDFKLLLDVLKSLRVGSLFLVGHEPHLGDFLSWVLGLPGRIEFKKNSVACVEISSFVQSGGNLRWFIHPEQILSLIEGGTKLL